MQWHLCLNRAQEFLSVQIRLYHYLTQCYTVYCLIRKQINYLVPPSPLFPRKGKSSFHCEEVKQRPSIQAARPCSYKHNALICHLITKTRPIKISRGSILPSFERSTRFTYVLIIILSHIYFCSIYPIIKQHEPFLSVIQHKGVQLIKAFTFMSFSQNTESLITTFTRKIGTYTSTTRSTLMKNVKLWAQTTPKNFTWLSRIYSTKQYTTVPRQNSRQNTLTFSMYTSRFKRLNFEFRNTEVHIHFLKLNLKDLYTFMFSYLTLFNVQHT